MTVTTNVDEADFGYICTVEGTLAEVIAELCDATSITSTYKLDRLEDMISPPFYNGTNITCVYLKPNV